MVHNLQQQTRHSLCSEDFYVYSKSLLRAHDLAAHLRRSSFGVRVFPTLERMEAEIGKEAPLAVILDFDFDKDTAISAMGVAIQRQRIGNIFPIVWISERGSFDARLAAARIGADAYFTHPIDIKVLLSRTESLIRAHEVQPDRILIIASDEQHAQNYERLLKDANMTPRFLNRLVGLFEELDDHRPELVLIDVALQDCVGRDIARLIRQNDAYADIPIMVVADDNNQMLDKGGWPGIDNLTVRPVDAALLIAQVRNLAERCRTLRALILRDSLTGLYNHAAIKEQLASEMFRHERGGSPLSLAMIDIDFFKKVNDTYGHPVGDQVIRALSRLLREELRRTDIIGRYGGEEFAVIFPDTNMAGAVAVLEKIRNMFSAMVHGSGEEKIFCTFSAGVADISLDRDADALFKIADAALYRAKHDGRNCIRTP